MKINKWSKIESIFDRLFNETKTTNYEEINRIEKEFDRHFMARTTLTSKKMGTNIKEHTLSKEVIDIVDFSIIEDLPTWKPKLLDNFYIVFKTEPRKVKALWGCFENNYLMICGEMLSSKLISALFYIDFEKKQYDFGKSDLYDESITVDNETGLYFLRFILTLALLIEAEQSPLVLKKELCKCSPSVYGGKFLKIKNIVSIQQEFSEKLKESATVQVRGFLRNQAVGKNWSEHRVIYIAPFERTQIVNKKKIYSSKEVADLTGVAEVTARMWAAKNEVPFEGVGRRKVYMWTESKVNAFKNRPKKRGRRLKK